MSNNKLTTQKQHPRFSVAIQTAGYQKMINDTLGDPERAKRFVASITSAVATNPALQECEASTILAGALLGESINLSPSPQLGQYYLVPFETRLKDANGKAIPLFDERGQHLLDKRGRWMYATEKRAQFILGVRGYVQLALRSGYYKHLNVLEIKSGELKEWNPITEDLDVEIIPDDDDRAAAPTIGYMASFEYLNGFKKTIYWSKKKMLNHADTYSPAFSAEAMKRLEAGKIPENEMWKYSSFWYKNFDEMAKKTMLRQLISRWGVMSTELQNAFESDSQFADMSDDGRIKLVSEDDIEPPMIYDSPENEAPAIVDEEQPKEEPKPEKKTARARKTAAPAEAKQIGMDDLG